MPSAMYLAVDRVSQLRVLASMYIAVVSVISNCGFKAIPLDQPFLLYRVASWWVDSAFRA